MDAGWVTNVCMPTASTITVERKMNGLVTMLIGGKGLKRDGKISNSPTSQVNNELINNNSSSNKVKKELAGSNTVNNELKGPQDRRHQMVRRHGNKLMLIRLEGVRR